MSPVFIHASLFAAARRMGQRAALPFGESVELLKEYGCVGGATPEGASRPSATYFRITAAQRLRTLE